MNKNEDKYHLTVGTYGAELFSEHVMTLTIDALFNCGSIEKFV